MSEPSSNNKRIAKNTIFLYFRMLLLMLISLYTSRVVLDKLGIVDYGIHNVVAGFVVLLGFFNTSLSNVSQRFLNIELEHGNIAGARCVFNQHLIIYVGIIFIVLLVGETFGLWFVSHRLVIPTVRLTAALCAYQFALFSLVITLCGLIYSSVIIAHEDMQVYSYVGIAEGFAKLGVAYLLGITHDDRLILYSFLLMVVTISSRLVYAVYCHLKYEECQLKWVWDMKRIRQAESFIGWNFIGTILYMLQDQFINILMNLFYGPIVNAARAITFQVSGAVTSFNNNFFTAVRPQIVKSYASNQIVYLKNLFFKSTKFSLFLMFFLCLPIMMNIHFILELWLGRVPEYTEEFTIWVLIDCIISAMTYAPWAVTMAMGNLRRYVLFGNGIMVVIAPLAYVALLLGAPPVSPFIIILLVRLMQVFCILRIVNGSLNFGYIRYFKQVIIPFVKVVSVALPLSFILCELLNATTLQILIEMILICLINIVSIWMFGTSSSEKSLCMNYLRHYL